eukprot:COSAG06_NODE_3818_length_4876_cov_168.368223_7_plen_67_part_00
MQIAPCIFPVHTKLVRGWQSLRVKKKANAQTKETDDPAGFRVARAQAPDCSERWPTHGNFNGRPCS